MSNGTAPGDRTARAVATQVSAMGCMRYEIGVLDAVRRRMLLRTWTVPELEISIPWLKRANAQEHDIYIRPSGSVGLILLDDLDPSAIARLRQDGLTPAVVVETSPGNCQAWLRVTEQPIAPDQATMVARILAERYGGDPASADWRHFGRLAGFTNRKPKHRQEGGMQPFVLVREAAGVIAERGPDLLEEAGRRVLLQRIDHAQPAPLSLDPPPDGSLAPGDLYRHYAARILPLYPVPDWSRIDWMVCRDIASSSLAIDVQHLAQALREGSPYLDTMRKRGHVDDYIARTARKVMRDPEVVAARQRLNGNGHRHL